VYCIARVKFDFLFSVLPAAFCVQVDCDNVAVVTGAGLSTGENAGLGTIRGISSFGPQDKFDAACIGRVRPTLGHLILVALRKAKFINFLLSQNIENLHPLSGFPNEDLCELHGNVCRAVCSSCEKLYLVPPASGVCACYTPPNDPRL